MWPPSSPNKHAVLSLNSTRPSRLRRRRVRHELQLERLEDRQLLSVPTVSFIKQDTTTQGTWIGTYGSQGYDVIGNAASLPSYTTVTPAGQASYTWAASSTDPRALQNAGGSGRIAACWYSASSFTVDVNLTDGQTHDLELYFLDWDSTARSEKVQISNASTGAVLNTETVTSFHSGVYLDWAVSGNVDITVTHLAGANAVLSGLFFDPPATALPTVTVESPASAATNVAVSSSVSATFNEAVQASSIGFTLKTSSGTAVAATIAYNSSTDTATLTPKAALAYGTTYTATVSGAKSNAGVAMSSPVSWSFTTDKVQPAVASYTPLSGATGVAVSSPLTATFNEAVQSSTISFTLTNSAGTAVPATLTYNSSTDTATFTPSAALAYGTTYKATVSGAKDTAGDPLAAPVSWSFTTDAVQPAVASYTPLSGATGVAVSSPLTATFNEAVQSSTISFTLTNSAGTSVPATVSYNSSTDTATLTPSSALAYGTTYTATVSGAKDTAGDPLAAPVSWSFTTDKVQPAVASYTPLSGATGVAVSSPLTATFNEAVQSSTISFTLTNAGTSVPATVSYNSSTDAVTLTPSSALAYGTTYMATVSGTKDTAGDPMSGSVSWSFTTATSNSSALTVSAGSNVTTNAGSTVTFAGAVSGGTAPYTYSWNFGDGTTSAGNSASSTQSAGISASFTNTDTTTQGNWIGVYGSAGYNVIGDSSSYPSYAVVTPSSQSSYTWASSTTDTRALQTPENPSNRVAACWYSSSSFVVDVNLTDGNVHPVSLYAMDMWTPGLNEQVQVLNASTGAVLDTRTLTDFSNGEYLTWNISGHVQFQVTGLDGGNGEISGLFIGNASSSGGGSTTLTPSHVYSNPGTYTATLTATDSAGHSGSSSTTVTVNDVAPTVTFADPPAVAGSPVSFTASATDVSPAVQTAGFTYAWNFGDGGTGSGATTSHTYASAGTYTVSVTATDEYGGVSKAATSALTISAASSATVIPINATWLQNNGPAPYVLTQAGATYQLETNVTTSGTAFVILNQNITLDLNGYTVTYGNSSPITVTNGGFEQGSGTNVPGWNLGGAPSAAIAPNNCYLFGNQVLQLSNFSTTQTIVSSPISGLVAGHTYTSTITPAGVNSNSSVTLNVIDTVTGATLGSAASANVQRGFSAVVTFTPTTTDPVKLQVVVTPVSGSDTLDLDQATLTPSCDYGIVASRAWGNLPGGGDFGPGYQNLGAAVQAIWNSDRMSVTNVTIENGSIVQGQAAGYSSSPVDGVYGYGITLNSLHTSDSGVDTTSIDLNYMMGGGATITNSTLTQTGGNVTDRMAGPATISLSQTSASPILIQGNTLTGCLQTGIGIDTSNGPIIINNNQISQNTVVPDAAGIALVAVSNFQVTNNTITPTAGEGIAIDGYRAQGSNLGVIQNNTVTTKEVPNREMGLKTQARALRLRNDVDSEGPQTNIDISGNTFTTTIGPGMSNVGYTVWITYVNNNGAMNNANVNLHNNTITLINDSSDPSYSGSALLVDGMDPGINMTISNNILASNDTSLSIGGYNDANVNDLTFLSNTLSKSSSGATRTYTGISAGFDVTQISSVQIIDTKLANGATSNIVWSGTGTKDVEVGWLLNVTVQNADGSAASGAAVQIFNSSNSLVYAGVANANGLLSGIMVLSTMYQQTGTDSTQITTTNSGTFLVTAANGTKKGSASVSLTGDQNLTIVVN